MPLVSPNLDHELDHERTFVDWARRSPPTPADAYSLASGPKARPRVRLPRSRWPTPSGRSHAGRYRDVVLLRCTTRLLKLLGSRAGVLVDAEPAVDDWYANVFVVERRKCLLFVHADTLFSVLTTDVRVPQLDDLGVYIATHVVDALASEGLAATALGPTDPSGVRVAKTANRRVLGHMKEMSFDAQHLIRRDGGLRLADLDSVNRRLRRQLRGRDSRGEYVVPLELAAACSPSCQHARVRRGRSAPDGAHTV